MEKRRVFLIAASAFAALIMGIFSNIAASYIAPAFTSRNWLVWAIVLVTFVASVVLTSYLDKSKDGLAYSFRRARVKFRPGRAITGALVGAIVAPILFTLIPNWRYVVLQSFSFVTSRILYDTSQANLFFAILGGAVGILVGILFDGLAAALVGGVFGIFSGVSFAVMFGGIVALIIHFGEWRLIADKIGSLAMWGLAIGGAVGALGGFLVGLDMSRDWD